MGDTSFLPITVLSPVGVGAVPLGSLVYLMRDKAFALSTFGDHERFLLSLGGERPFTVDLVIDDDETALVVSDWRIEVDVASAVDVRFERLAAGQAFIAGGQVGIVGRRPRGYGLPVSITASGKVDSTSSNAHRGAFTRWRIVAGPSNRPAVLVESDGLASAPER